MRGQSEEDEEKPLPLPPPPLRRSVVVVREYSGGARHSSTLFSEAMRHLFLPDFLKAPDADTGPCRRDE